MKLRKLFACVLVVAMTMSLAACGETKEAAGVEGVKESAAPAVTVTADEGGFKQYADIVVGEDFTDLSAEISFFSNRTDLDSEEYGGKRWVEYMEDFNKIIMPRFDVGGRWMDDIYDNNVRRESR